MWRTHCDTDRGLSAATSALQAWKILHLIKGALTWVRPEIMTTLSLASRLNPPGRRALDLEDAQRGAMLILQKPVGAGDLR
jgi:hypothetical protein